MSGLSLTSCKPTQNQSELLQFLILFFIKVKREWQTLILFLKFMNLHLALSIRKIKQKRQFELMRVTSTHVVVCREELISIISAYRPPQMGAAIRGRKPRAEGRKEVIIVP